MKNWNQSGKEGEGSAARIYETIFEHAPIGIEIYDEQGLLVEVNGKCQEIFGVTEASALGGFKLFDDPNLSEENRAVVKQGGSLHYEAQFMDDEESVRNAMRDILEMFGYRVVCKQDGRDAIGFLVEETKANRKLAAMVLDLTVPGGMGGREAIGEIRKLGSEIPVFVVSGCAEDPVMADPSAHGFTASLCKPFRQAELAKMLSRYLNASE